MTRRPRLGRAVAAALLVTLVGVGGLAAPPVAAQDPPPAAEGSGGDGDGLLSLAGCLQGTRHLAVSLVFDESRSLRGTDPENRRVDAAVNALVGLQELTSGPAGQRMQVDVEVAAFSDRYRVALPWTSLDASTSATIRQSLVSFRQRVNGIETDIVSALTGARSALSAHGAEVESSGADEPCKAVVLFTDGDYVVNARKPAEVAAAGTSKPYAPGADLRTDEGAARATEAGREAACEPGGVADDLRADDIVLLSVMLRSEASDDDFLARITTGDGAGGPCGERPARGEFLPASDADALVTGFDEVATRAAGGTPTECVEGECDDGSRTFDLDALTRRVRVLAVDADGGLQVELTGPGDESTTIEGPGDFEIGDLTGTASEVEGRGLAIVMDRPDDLDGWEGAWTVTVQGDDAASATVQVYVFSDVRVRAGSGRLVRGEAAEVTAELVLPEGRSADDFLRSATAEVEVEDPISGRSSAVALEGPVGGPYVGSFTAPTDMTANAVNLTARLSVVTVDGSTITTQSPPQLVPLRRPLGSVQFVPDVLELDTIEGESSTTGELTLVAGESAGCVWFEAARFDTGGLTMEIDGQAALDAASCIAVPAGQTVTVPVEVSSSRRADATVHGVLRLHEKAAGAEATVTDLEVSTSLVRGVDEARRVVLAIVLLLAGLLIPLGLLLLINTVTARFQSLDVVRGAAVPVTLSPAGIERTDGARRRLRFHDRDFESLAEAGNVRRFTFGGVEFRAKASRNPFGVTWAQAAPEGGAEKLKGGVGRRVELDTALSGSWVFLLDPDRTRAEQAGVATGTLLAFVTEGPSSEQFDRLLVDLDRRLPRVAADLETAVRSQPATSGAKSSPLGRRGRRGADDDGTDPDGDAADPPSPSATS